jgi:hypothetical protein
MHRKTNKKLLREFLEKQGDFGKTELSLKARVSVSMIEKMVVGTYGFVPREVTRERICAATGISEDELFPLVTAKGERAS